MEHGAESPRRKIGRSHIVGPLGNYSQTEPFVDLNKIILPSALNPWSNRICHMHGQGFM